MIQNLFKQIFSREGIHLLLMSNKKSSIQRKTISRKTIFFVSAVVSLFLLCFGVVTLGLAHYSYRCSVLSDSNLKLAEYARERESVMNNISQLRESVSRTERFLASQGDILIKADAESAKKADNSNPSVDWNWRYFSNDLKANGIESLDLLLAESTEIEKVVHSSFSATQDMVFYVDSQPRIWPTRGYVTSEFGGWRKWGGADGLHRHTGIDIAAPTGTSINAVSSGTVTYVGYQRGYGKVVKVDHGYGMTTLYAHCSMVFAVEGERVKSGDRLAAVGSTGRSTGPHLHFEVRIDGVPVNPKRYLPHA
ncbi:MAG: M23 family metallopeptidase [Pseudomonadota bacterium]